MYLLTKLKIKVAILTIMEMGDLLISFKLSTTKFNSRNPHYNGNG